MIRNVAIVAHVDHGKTTLVDELLKQSNIFRYNESAMSQNLILDSNDQEKERGITILAKNTAVNYKGTRINIIDTPGHADFAGEVERSLSMADGILLLVDAQEGTRPQTKYVLKKAFEMKLQPIVVINKIDKQYADSEKTLSEIYDLFLELASDESQLEFPVYYAIGREGKCWENLPADINQESNLIPLFEGILKHIPPPYINIEAPLQVLISALDWDSFRGKYVIGKINKGIARPGAPIALVNKEGIREISTIGKLYQSYGIKRQEVDEVKSGDIVAITGLKNGNIGDTITDPDMPISLPSIKIEEPTLKMSISPNTSPFAGREGSYVTGRQILERIQRELETNVAFRLNITEQGKYVISGRGELHLSVFIETLRREGYELEIGRPEVITKVINGVINEPTEELTIDVDTQYCNTVTGEIYRRKGLLISQEENNDGTTRLVFEISTRGLLGLRSQLLNLSRGTAIMNSIFLKFNPKGDDIPKMRRGALISATTGRCFAYGLNNAQNRGSTFVLPQTEVYTGMIIGINNKESDLEINITKEKKATNVRSSSSDEAIMLTPPIIMSLEECIDFLEDDELLEVTPNNLRLRKKILNAALRAKAKKKNKEEYANR